MKKIIILYISLFLLSCVSAKQEVNIESCPRILFSQDHRFYITTEESRLTYDNISYKAELNNYYFDSECIVSNNILNVNLSLFFIVKPEKTEQVNIILPYFVAVLDDQQKIIDIQYYKKLGVFNKNEDKSLYIETEIIENLNIIIPYKNNNEDQTNRILLGFMLDKEKLKILN